MKCPRCESTSNRKNGRLKGRQRYQCKDCGRQFLEAPASFQDDGGLDVQHERRRLVPQIAPFTQELLQLFNSSEFLESLAFQQILQTLPGKQQIDSSCPSALSILLLDAENINDLDGEVERFLSQLSTYPLRVKLAFANWKKTGGDTELYHRGYQMIHVPLGKDSADAQMIAMGAAISQHYPHAKEVFVCSSDWLLTYLITELQQQGLSVYRLSKKPSQHSPKMITVEQMNTGEIKSYSLTDNLEIPSSQNLMGQLETLINETHESLEERLEKLSKINTIFEIKNRLETPQNPSCCSKVPSPSETEPSVKVSEEITQPPVQTISINSQKDLETAIDSTLTACLKRSQQKTILINELAMEFKKIYEQPPKFFLKKLKLGSKFCNFLQKCEDLALSKQKNVYRVGFKKSSGSAIQSRKDLENSILKILEKLQPKYSNSLVPLEVLSQQFQAHYHTPLSQIIKQLNLGNKVINFIESCNVFTLKKQQNKYHITRAKNH